MCCTHNGKAKAVVVERSHDPICVSTTLNIHRQRPGKTKDNEMAHVIANRISIGNPILKLRDIWDRFQARLARQAEFNRSYAKLQNISASELKEFGLYRSDLPELAHKAVK
jgi:uncharacterized protein YjiS (DUF1127 family)